MASNVANRYRPKHFADPELDVAMKTIYDQVYTLNDQAIIGTETQRQMASGLTAVTGSKDGIVTGLASVANVVASLDSGGSPLNEWVTANPTTPGRQPTTISLQVWKPTNAGDNTPIASTTERTVRWFAFGQRVQPAQ